MPVQNTISRIHVLRIPFGDKKKVAQGTTEILLDTRNLDFPFKAGQYIRITIPDLSPDVPGGNTHDFSISSSPNEKNSLSITFRESDSAFKQALLALPKGAELIVRGPLGVFTLPDDPKVPLIFIAGGIGVTPFLSMIRFATENKLTQKIQLLYSNSTEERATYAEELRILAQKNPNFILIEKTGRIDINFIKEQTHYDTETLWYICGLPEMVLDFTKIIPQELKVSESKIQTEGYVGYDKSNEGYRVAQVVEEQVKEEEKATIDDRLVQPLLDAASQAALISITDVQGNILYVNDKFIEVAKYSREELYGQNHRILKSGLHPPEFYRELWKTISGGKLWRGEIKNRAKDGISYWVDASITPVFNAKGDIERYVGVRFLITDKKELEKSKKEILEILEDVKEEKNKVVLEKDKINTILQSIGDGVFVVDKDYKLTMFNNVASDLTGFSSQEVLGKKFNEILKFVDGETGKVNDNFITKVLETGEIKEMAKDTVLVRQDGSKLAVADSAAPLKNNDNEIIGCVVVFRDVSKEREVDRMKNEFISLASHQLRTPLSAMKWFCEMLLTGDAGDLNKEQAEFVQNINESNTRMIDLVNSLLNISRIESGRIIVTPKPTDLSKVIDAVLKELEQKIKEKNITLVPNINKIPEISVDPKLIMEVYANLLSNAVKYTPENGKITIILSEYKDQIVTQISDTGYGIPKEQQDKVFSKFFRAENIQQYETDGNGLGLYLVKAIVGSSGGKIWFESEENKGTTFFISLPKQGVKAKKGEIQLNA